VWLTELPERSLPVHPTQLYSSVNALLLAVLVALVFPFRRRHGQVIALLLTLYAITRFLLEIIRTDEGEIVAQLTISQSVSVAMAMAMLALWVYVYLQPPLPAPLRRV
jgi:phosphatidylglycerol:prolipoprotein diacylglycerol transferase